MKIDKIPVLFVDKTSNYKKFSYFDSYDFERNAFNFYSSEPLIAHPPCQLFSKLRKFSNKPLKEKQFAFFALEKVRRNGGILEHPRSSTLWKTGNFDLSGKVDSYGGFLRSVDLTWFGFSARKTTMLYFVGLQPGQLPSFPYSLNPPEKLVENIHTSKRSETPQEMILFFLEVISIIKNNNSSFCLCLSNNSDVPKKIEKT